MDKEVKNHKAQFDRMVEALEIHAKYNKLHNDLDAYLYDIIIWALQGEKKPNPESFGLKEHR